MVEEIRDLETDGIAIEAAQTCHLVLSTLHTNDALQTIMRLAKMGVPPYNVASALSLIVAQRLTRGLCGRCKTVHDVPQEVLLKAGIKEAELTGIKIPKPVGVDQSNNGYKNRAGIYQLISISEAMDGIILEGGNAMQLAEQARRGGIRNLRESGLKS
jgi:type IV pilus assembly protein PilB